MSLTAQATAVSKEYFDPTMRQLVYEESAFWAWLKKNKHVKTISGGRDIAVPVRYKKLGQAEAANPRDQFVAASVDTRTQMVLNWKYYRGRTMYHWDESIYNAGEQKIIDLMKDKAKELKEDIQDVLYADLYATTQGDLSFSSLPTIIDSANTYGGIAVADAAEWASTEDGTQTKLLAYGDASISEAINAATFGRDKPTVHLTTRDLYSAFEALLQPQQRYESKAMASLGFDSVEFRGTPIVADALCPAGYWFGIDANQFEIFVAEGNDLDIGDWFSMEQAGYPKSMARFAVHVMNLVCRSRKTSFKFTALDYTA